jgi:hypothetical protein
MALERPLFGVEACGAAVQGDHLQDLHRHAHSGQAKVAAAHASENEHFLVIGCMSM